MVYDIDGNIIGMSTGASEGQILVGAVMGASSESARFSAMKQLFDIGKKRIADPGAVIDPSEFTYATRGAVCVLPNGMPGMYQKADMHLLYTYNGSTQDNPASVTKTMSLITGMDVVEDVHEIVTIKSSDVTGGSGNYFSAGDTMTVQELMLAMMLPSSNTAATAFSRICGAKFLEAEGVTNYTDDECKAKFVTEMNEKAAYIGMINSVWYNGSGAHQDTMTTCSDLVRMLVEACSYPQILKVWNKKSYTIPVGGTNPRSVSLTTTVSNLTLEAYYTILGGKTGSLGSYEALVMVAKIK